MTTEQDRLDAQNAVSQATQALRRGNRTQARRWASLAARLDPENEVPWLIMAGIASPQASVAYLTRALELNPHSEAARQGMQWAVRRLRKHQASQGAVTQKAQPARAAVADSTAITKPAGESTQPVRIPAAMTQPVAVHKPGEAGRRQPRVLWAVGVFVLVFGALLVMGLVGAGIVMAQSGSAEQLISALFAISPTPAAAAGVPAVAVLPTASATAEIVVPSATATDAPLPTASETAVPAATSTAEATPTAFEPATATPTPEFTITPVVVETYTPTATEVPTETPTEPPPAPSLPDGVDTSDHWIDVDLSDQMVYAYDGDVLVNQFLVSTGTWQTPTVVGTFKVYVKYRYADMSGPGYYLANVPYVMYFYKGYGLHGTYWHSNFGTPMSHGCINLQTDQAGWLFDFSSVGTVVNIHD